MSKTKYIKTENNQIVVFGEYYTHDEFIKFKPISAGFINFGNDANGFPDCACYGESISLGLKADEKEDTELARNQIMGYGYFLLIYEYDCGKDFKVVDVFGNEHEISREDRLYAIDNKMYYHDTGDDKLIKLVFDMEKFFDDDTYIMFNQL
jgi:hypothetical protein